MTAPVDAATASRISPLDFLRRELLDLSEIPLNSIDPALQRMQWNENPQDFPASLKQEVLARLAALEWSRYPLSLRPRRLQTELAEQLNLAPESVVISSGSSDLIRITMSATLAPGHSVVLPAPTFLLYTRYAHMLGARVVNVPLDVERDFALPVDTMLKQAESHGARLLAVCAPNNPTGTVYPRAELERLAASTRLPVLIDEAYGDFSGQDLRPMVDKHDNVILVRTFSKARALAGVRIGYLLAQPALAMELQKTVNSFVLNIFSEVAALVALDHTELLRAGVEETIAERERLHAALDVLNGLRVTPSGANFLCVHVDPALGAKALADYLLHEHQILINNMTAYPALSEWVRVSVGTPQENSRLLTAVRAFVTQV